LELEDEDLERLGFLEDLRKRSFRVRERVNFGRERMFFRVKSQPERESLHES